MRRLIGRLANLNRRSFVLSFPKSGRTWHRVMLGHVLSQVAGLPPEEAMSIRKLCDCAWIGRVEYSHNGANFTDATDYRDPRVADASEWAGKPTLLIVRDPRDVLVSAYHHAKFRDRIFDGSISNFIRSPQTGIDKVLTALNRWSENRDKAARFDVVSYEAMHRSPEAVVRDTIVWLGVKASDSQIIAAVEFARFDRMKEYERANFFGSKRMSLIGDPEQGAKVRAGKIGGYVDYLSADDLAYIRERTRVLGDPFEALYGGAVPIR